MECWLIFWEEADEIVASNILESSIGGTVVIWVCEWLKVIAEQEGVSIQEVVEDILQEDKKSDLYLNY